MKHIIPSEVLQKVSSTFHKIIPAEFLQKVTSLLKKIIPAGFLQKISSAFQRIVPQKYRKWLVLGLALILALVLVCCMAGSGPSGEAVTCTVSAENLEVHKKHKAESAVLGQLPEGLEIQLLEQKTVGDTEWGLIEKTVLSDGTKVKSGWIDLQYVRFPGDPIIEPEPSEPVVVEPPEPIGVPATMGTVITGKLNIRKAAGSQYDAIDSYVKGDRIEILETVTVGDTVWGRTSIGWVGMGYVRMDGTAAPESSEEEDPAATKIVSDGNLLILGYGVVDLGTLNVRSGPGTDHEKVSAVTEGNRYAYYQVQNDWVRIEDGWVSSEYFYMEGTTAEDAATGVIITDDLNYRTGPATSFKSNGTLKKGAPVQILAQVNGWGYTPDGWVNMSHVEFTYSTGTGTITSGLNIRKDPNADSEVVDAYKEGDRVTILEVSGTWGKTDKGWINLKYVKYD